MDQRYLIDAVLQQLRSSPAAAAFGDTFSVATGTGTEKFSADFAAQPDLPYLVISENPSHREYMTPTAAGVAFLEAGSMYMVLMASARDTAKDLATVVSRALADVEYRWSSQYDSGRTMAFRLGTPPNPEAVMASAEGSPVQFQVGLNFVYQAQGIM